MKIKTLCLFVGLTAIALPAPAAVVFNSLSTYTQNFNDFRGTGATLPDGFSFAGGGTDIFRGTFDSTSTVAGDFTGVMGATSDGSNFSVAWRESTGSANLDDGRLFLTITNNTGVAITGFHFSYDLEAWVRGARVQEMRFKYDNLLSSPDRSAFQTDILPRAASLSDDNLTRNPGHASPSGTVLDGNSVRTQVAGTILLANLLIDETVDDPDNPLFGQTFGALQPGETAYFRWQISNIGSESGNRSAFGINHFSITPIPEPGTTLLAALAGLALLARRRRD